MSLVSSAAVLTAIASVSLGGCAGRTVTPVRQTLSPATMYRLCSDVQFQCRPADLQTVPAGTEQAPIQMDTNLATPAKHSNLG